MSRSVPANTSAEQAILAAMLMRNGEAIPKVQSLLSPDDFYKPEHRIIYQSIMDLYIKKTGVDNVMLCDYLKKQNKLDDVGGLIFIMSLGDVVPTTANIIYHANIVKEKAILRRLIEAGESIISEAYDDSGDINRIMDDAEQKIFSITSRETNGGGFEHIRPIIERVFAKINEVYENGGGHTGVATGFADLDRITSGLQDSDLILIAARPSMGKTAFALNLAANVSLGNQRLEPQTVAVFSLEMSKEQLGKRLISSYSGVESQRLSIGQLNNENWTKVVTSVDTIARAKLYIDDTPGLTVMELRSRARQIKSLYGLKLIVIDYLQLMQGRPTKGGGDGNRQQEISEISRSLKAMARELSVPVVALSQLSRAVEMRAEKKPQLSDLRESGSLEQDADIVMFLYREDYYNPDTENKNITELIVAKHRNGPTQTIKLQFNKSLIRFGNLATNLN